MFRRFLSRSRTPIVRPTYQPRLEALEDRWVPATASFSKGTLTVTAAAGDLNIDFFQDTTRPIGHITVEDDGLAIFNDPAGLDPTRLVKNIVVKVPGSVTTVDVNFDALILVGNLTINSKATTGIDVSVDGVDITKNFKFTSTAVTAGDTLDIIDSIVEGTTTASLGDGANATTVTDSYLRGDVLVSGKSGVDTVNLETIHMEGLATFNLGGGANQLGVINGTSSADKGLVYTGGSGTDILNVVTGNFHTGSGNIQLGDGANQVNFTPAISTTFGNSLSIKGGVDVDDVTLSDIIIGGNANIKLGNGTQILDMTQVIVQKALTITGGNQVDDVTLQEVAVSGATTITLLDGNDILDIDDSFFVRKALIEGGEGNDDFFIEDDIALPGSTSFGGKFTIKGGNGDDDLTLGDVGNPADAATVLAINGATTNWLGGADINVFSNSLGANLFDNGTPPNENWV